MKQFLTAIIALMCMVHAAHAQYRVKSPDGIIQVKIDAHRDFKGLRKFIVPTYTTIQVTEGDRQIVYGEIGTDVKWHGHRYSFGKIDIDRMQTDTDLKESTDTRDGALRPFGDTYNRLQLGVKPGIILEVRVYNEGVAYQFRISGISDDYKILRLCDPFPNERPIAIVGTFSGEHILPWSVLDLSQYEHSYYYEDFHDDIVGDSDTADEADDSSTGKTQQPADPTLRPSRSPFRLVSWRDALSSVSVGASVNLYHGSVWRHMNTDYSYDVNLTYKYLYAGISYAPCNELLFITYTNDYEPFLGVMGSVHQWKVGGRLGVSLPFQQGMELWNVTPYVATSLMRIRQHGEPMKDYHKPTLHSEYLVGPGMSIQVAIAGRYVWALHYEYQLFTGGKLTPKGMHVFGTSFGLMF